MNVAHHDTPLGAFTVVVDEDGVVLASGFSPDSEALRSRIRVSGGAQTLTPRRDLGPVSRAVRAYFDGDVRAIDAVGVRQTSGHLIEDVWRRLRLIPPGETVTYARLAAACGRPAAVRAAGQGCARNACLLFVPCHRVVRSDGTLGGFRDGLHVKRWLLAHEGWLVGHSLRSWSIERV
jgi:methylated-DNA-[protein]-cysteine S-methyltransferase